MVLKSRGVNRTEYINFMEWEGSIVSFIINKGFVFPKMPTHSHFAKNANPKIAQLAKIDPKRLSEYGVN